MQRGRPRLRVEAASRRQVLVRHRDGAGTRSRGRLRYMGATPRPQMGFSAQPGVDGIRERVMAAAVQIISVPNQMLVRFALPERNDFLRQQLVDLVRSVGFPTVQDVAQAVPWHRPDDDVRVVGHHDPRVQLVAPTLKETNRAGDKVRESGVAEVTDAVAAIEVFVHAIRIPAEEFFLLMPCEGAFCRHRVLKDRVALHFKAEQDILWQRAGLAERGEIRASLLLQMRKDASEMEAADEWVRLFRCSAAVPAASSGGVPPPESAGGVAWAQVPAPRRCRNSQARTPALRRFALRQAAYSSVCSWFTALRSWSAPPNLPTISATLPCCEIGGTLSTSGRVNWSSPSAAYFSSRSFRISRASGAK